MINIPYQYLIFSLVVFSLSCYLFLNLKTSKTELNNKILLKKLLEGLDLELPEELKTLGNSPIDH